MSLHCDMFKKLNRVIKTHGPFFTSLILNFDMSVRLPDNVSEMY